MKKIIASLLTVAALGFTAVTSSAQTTPPPVRILVVDMASLLDGHHKTAEQNARLQSDERRAREELERLNTEGNTLVEQLRAINEQIENPTLAESARTKLRGDAQAKIEEIQRKQADVQTFQSNTQNSFQQRIRTFRNVLLEEIGKVSADVAKQRGGTLVLDKSGPSLIGISSVVYADPSYDITEAVRAVIDRDRPAGTPAASAVPAAPAAPADENAVRFPSAR